MPTTRWITNMKYKSAADLFNESRARITQVTPQETMRLLQSHPETILVDCRESNEWNLARIPGALFIPRGILESNIERAAARDRKIIIYCASGNRSALAAESLEQMGYHDVASMSGGIKGWMSAGGEVES